MRESQAGQQRIASLEAYLKVVEFYRGKRRIMDPVWLGLAQTEQFWRMMSSGLMVHQSPTLQRYNLVIIKDGWMMVFTTDPNIKPGIKYLKYQASYSLALLQGHSMYKCEQSEPRDSLAKGRRGSSRLL